MYVRGPQHSITGGDSPPSIFKWGGGGNTPPLGRRRPAGATGARVEMINQNRGGRSPPAPPLHAPLR